MEQKHVRMHQVLSPKCYRVIYTLTPSPREGQAESVFFPVIGHPFKGQAESVFRW